MRITPVPTDEEAAAIAAAVTMVLDTERAELLAAAATRAASRDDSLHLWVTASRRSAQRAGLQRGPWRLSGRIARRSRA